MGWTHSRRCHKNTFEKGYTMNIIQKIKSFFKKKPKRRTLNETIEYINRNYHFNDFNEELIDEIYSLLLDYGKVNVTKISVYKYILNLDIDGKNKLCTVTEEGIIVIN